MQFQADILDSRICRPQIRETTALGAASLAGIAVGFWSGSDELKSRRKIDRVFEPSIDDIRRETLLTGWRKAVGRSRDWAN
jgi:glycerol kinase